MRTQTLCKYSLRYIKLNFQTGRDLIHFRERRCNPGATINNDVLQAGELIQRDKVVFFFSARTQRPTDFPPPLLLDLPWLMHDFDATIFTDFTSLFLALYSSPLINSDPGESIDQFRSGEIALCARQEREWSTRGNRAKDGSATSLVSVLSFVNAHRYLLAYFHSAAKVRPL